MVRRKEPAIFLYLCIFALAACVQSLARPMQLKERLATRDAIRQRPKEAGPYRPTGRIKRASSSIGKSSLKLLQSQIGTSLNMSSSSALDYKCAKYCSCSYKPVLSSRSSAVKVNMSQAKCEDLEFNDILSLDRRTQIIHISLPSNGSLAGSDANEQFVEVTRQFRMPRLVQFTLLREIVIVNLRFEICDSEVFKKGQNLRRVQWNHNHLRIITKACLKYLDKLIELDLSFNRLEELESAIFSSLVNLRSLRLAHNQLSDLAAHQFANLTRLTSLNLVANQFKSINLHLFEPMQTSLRLLLLSNNQIKSFVHTTPSLMSIATNTPVVSSPVNNRTSPMMSSRAQQSSTVHFVGTIFKSLIKLNVDQNKFERIKSLQLHRFYNVKFLSIRRNNIATIRDKAFNGLKLIEMNLAENKLQSVSKCAFCNATIKRLILAKNNITIPLPSVLIDLPNIVPAQSLAATMGKGVSVDQGTQTETSSSILSLSQSTTSFPTPIPATSAPTTGQHASQNVLILSQSIFGPLFANLEYLDISSNEYLAEDLELLLEPLLQLKYLNLASTGLDEALPTPTLFKNLHMLKYLNLSHNQLDQLVSETLEPLTSLKVLDLSSNRFSEMDESFLVTLEEMPSLELVHFGSNPWYCSQCKIGPLYEWIFRSPIYNSTCLMPLTIATSGSVISSTDIINGLPIGLEEDLIAAEHQSDSKPDSNAKPVDYSLLIDDDWQLLDSSDTSKLLTNSIDFDIVLDSSYSYDEEAANYHMATETGTNLTVDFVNGETKPPFASKPMNMALLMTLITDQDDISVAHTINSLTDVVMSPSVKLAKEFCLRCEFPGELRSSFIHELSSADFKYCAGSAPRLAASEPKIGLTLAIVIILALFCIIVVVIVIYRKKSNTYYPNEETDRLDQSGTTGSIPKGKHPVLSVSSDMEHQYGDGTDYSSPPVSQPYESYSDDSPGGDLGEEEDEEEDDVDEDEEKDEDDEDEEDFEEDEYDEDEEGEEDNDDDDEEEEEDGGRGGGGYADGRSTVNQASDHEDARDEDNQQPGDAHNRNQSDERGPQHSSSGPNESDEKQATGDEAFATSSQSARRDMMADAEENGRSEIRHIDGDALEERATSTSRSSERNTSTSRSLERRSTKGKSASGSNKSSERTDSNKAEQQVSEASVPNQYGELNTTRSSLERSQTRKQQQQPQPRQSVETTASEDQAPPPLSSRPRQSLTKSLTTAGRKQRPALVLKSSLSRDTGQQVRVSKGLDGKVPRPSSIQRRVEDTASSYICETPLIENLVETASQMTASTVRSPTVGPPEPTASQRVLRPKKSNNESNDRAKVVDSSLVDLSGVASAMGSIDTRTARLARLPSGSQSSQRGSLQDEPIGPSLLQVKFAKGASSTGESSGDRRNYRNGTKLKLSGDLKTPTRRQIQSQALEALREKPREMLNNVVADATRERALRSRNQANSLAQPIKQAKLIRIGSQTDGQHFGESSLGQNKMADTRFTVVKRQAAVVTPQVSPHQATNSETNKPSKSMFIPGSVSSSVGSSGVVAGTSGTSGDCKRRSTGLNNVDSDLNTDRLRRLQPAQAISSGSFTDSKYVDEGLRRNENSKMRQQNNQQSHLYEDVRNVRESSQLRQRDQATNMPNVVRSRELISKMPKQARAVMSPPMSSEASTLADSLAFEGLEDLPSDLDIDALVEIPNAINDESLGNYELSYSPTATLVDEEMVDDERVDARRLGRAGESVGTYAGRQQTTKVRSRNSNQLHPSNSTHSALTQSSSREFNVSASPNQPG